MLIVLHPYRILDAKGPLTHRIELGMNETLKTCDAKLRAMMLYIGISGKSPLHWVCLQNK